MDRVQMKNEIEAHHATIATLRDSLRLRIHLAGMEARTLFEELEAGVARLSREVCHGTHRSVAELRNGYEYLASTLVAKPSP